ncbi:hypothetical protein FD754_004761 [Muntiacus muntjak]|uniref:Mos1 transposase HTH domain-containing protein n=1 Tax=Muntiacus muntjak TaxID=9888 RepID=A0A5N3WIQ4_MUNMU|nr:hypothetical protein FD754_004761 [Muntiacus muntjak]
MMLDKNLIQTILLFEFKMSHKAVETTHNINNAFGPGTANKCTVQWWFKKFCKGDESHEDEECSGRPSEVDNDQLRAIIEADPPTTIGEVAKELSVDHSVVVWHLKQIGKVMLSSLILPNNSVSFLDLIVMCDEKWIFTTVGDDQLSGWSKKLQSTSQSQTFTKKMSRSLFGGLLPV